MFDFLHRTQPKETVIVATARFYKTTMRDKSVRIVDASNQTKVRLHIAAQIIESIEPASARDVADAYKAGIKPEVAGEKPYDPNDVL